MQHFAVNDHRYYPLFEEISAMGAAVMIDVGTTAWERAFPEEWVPGSATRTVGHRRSGRGLPRSQDHHGAPRLALGGRDHGGGIAQGQRLLGDVRLGAEVLPGNLKIDMRARLQDKVMFGSDYPSMPYERILREWGELGYKDEIMEKIFHKNAERVLGCSANASRGENAGQERGLITSRCFGKLRVCSFPK